MEVSLFESYRTFDKISKSDDSEGGKGCMSNNERWECHLPRNKISMSTWPFSLSTIGSKREGQRPVVDVVAVVAGRSSNILPSPASTTTSCVRP